MVQFGSEIVLVNKIKLEEPLKELINRSLRMQRLIENRVKADKEISPEIVDFLLNTLDKILAINPEYPVYQFLPELMVNIELPISNYWINNQLPQYPEDEVDFKIYGLDTYATHIFKICLYQSLKLSIESPEFLKLISFRSVENKKKLLHLISYIRLYAPNKPTFIFQDLITFIKKLQKDSLSFSSYTRVYDTENRITEGAKYLFDETDFDSSHLNAELKPKKWFGKDNVKTLLGGKDLKPYIGNHQAEFLQQRTRIDLGDEETRNQIEDLLNHPQVQHGNSSEHFLDEVKLRQEDLQNFPVLQFIEENIRGDIYDNSNFEGNQMPIIARNIVCARFFSSIKFNSEHLKNLKIQDIIKRLAFVNAEIAISTLSDLSFTPSGVKRNLKLTLLKLAETPTGYNFVAQKLITQKITKEDLNHYEFLHLISQLASPGYLSFENPETYDFTTLFDEFALTSEDLDTNQELKAILNNDYFLNTKNPIALFLLKKFQPLTLEDFNNENNAKFWVSRIDYLCQNGEVEFAINLMSQIDFSNRVFLSHKSDQLPQILTILVNNGQADHVMNLLQDIVWDINDLNLESRGNLILALVENTDGKTIYGQLLNLWNSIFHQNGRDTFVSFLRNLSPTKCVELMKLLQIDKNKILNSDGGYYLLATLLDANQSEFVLPIISEHKVDTQIFIHRKDYSFVEFVATLIQSNNKEKAFEIIADIQITDEFLQQLDSFKLSIVAYFLEKMVEVGETDYVVNILERVNLTAEILQLETQTHFNELFIKLSRKWQAEAVIRVASVFIAGAFITNCRILTGEIEGNINTNRHAIINLVMELQRHDKFDFINSLIKEANVIITENKYQGDYKYSIKTKNKPQR